MQVFVELLLKSAQPVIVDAHVTQHLRADLIVRVKALELLLDIDAFEIQRLHLRNDRGVLLARDPDEVTGGGQTSVDAVGGGKGVRRIGVDYCRQLSGQREFRLRNLCRVFAVGDVVGNRVDRVHQDGHRQFVQVAVVENAAPRSYFKGALLLAGRFLDEMLMIENLQPHQPQRDDRNPEA